MTFGGQPHKSLLLSCFSVLSDDSSSEGHTLFDFDSSSDELVGAASSPKRPYPRRRVGRSPCVSKRPCTRPYSAASGSDCSSSADEYLLPAIPAGYLSPARSSCDGHASPTPPPRSVKKMRSRSDQPLADDGGDDFALKLASSQARIPAVCEKFLLSLKPRASAKLPLSYSPPARSSIRRAGKRHHLDRSPSDFDDDGYFSSS